MFADDRPGDAGVAVGVAAVDLVTIIQPNCNLIGRLRRLGPLENFFRPIHAQVSVHPTRQHHLLLRGVP